MELYIEEKLGYFFLVQNNKILSLGSQAFYNSFKKFAHAFLTSDNIVEFSNIIESDDIKKIKTVNRKTFIDDFAEELI